ncbi:MAG: hypothetical protein KA764_14165 [Anaerolineales bacterium]|nr:hypothetical protein [Anaerolineales bacterium]
MAAIALRMGAARRMGEPIQMAATQNGFFPRAFVWRGRRHDVRAVMACRTEARRGQVRRHLFQVRTDGAVYELAQDVAHDQWRLEQVWGAE